MKKFIIIFVLFFCLFVTGCESRNKNEVILKTTTNSLYTWKCEIEDDSIVRFERRINTVKEQKVDGLVEVKDIYKGISGGETTIICKYINTSNQDVKEEKSYSAFVYGDLSVEITKKEE